LLSSIVREEDKRIEGMKSYPATTHKDGQERVKDIKKEKEGCSCHWYPHGELLVMSAYSLSFIAQQ